MARLELLILQYGEPDWDGFLDLGQYRRSLTRGQEVQHDFVTQGLRRGVLPSETFARLILVEHHEALVNATLIPSASVHAWKQGGFYRLRLLEQAMPEQAFAPIPTELKARSFRSSSALRLTTAPEFLEDTLVLFGATSSRLVAPAG